MAAGAIAVEDCGTGVYHVLAFSRDGGVWPLPMTRADPYASARRDIDDPVSALARLMFAGRRRAGTLLAGQLVQPHISACVGSHNPGFCEVSDDEIEAA